MTIHAVEPAVIVGVDPDADPMCSQCGQEAATMRLRFFCGCLSLYGPRCHQKLTDGFAQALLQADMAFAQHNPCGKSDLVRSISDVIVAVIPL